MTSLEVVVATAPSLAVNVGTTPPPIDTDGTVVSVSNGTVSTVRTGSLAVVLSRQTVLVHVYGVRAVEDGIPNVSSGQPQRGATTCTDVHPWQSTDRNAVSVAVWMVITPSVWHGLDIWPAVVVTQPAGLATLAVKPGSQEVEVRVVVMVVVVAGVGSQMEMGVSSAAERAALMIELTESETSRPVERVKGAAFVGRVSVGPGASGQSPMHNSMLSMGSWCSCRLGMGIAPWPKRWARPVKVSVSVAWG